MTRACWAAVVAAMSACAGCGDGKFQELEAQLSAPDSSTRLAAATNLGALGDARAVDRLVLAALEDTSEFVRLASGDALARLNEPARKKAIQAFVAAIGSNEESKRVHAIIAIAKFKRQAAAACDPLSAALADPSAKVRQAAAAALADVAADNPKLAGWLRPVVQDASADVCVSAISTAIRAGLVNELIDETFAQTHCETALVRVVATQALSRVRSADEAWLSRLTELLNDESREVQKAALYALAILEVSACPAAPAVREMQKKYAKDYDMNRTIGDTLNRIDPPKR